MRAGPEAISVNIPTTYIAYIMGNGIYVILTAGSLPGAGSDGNPS